MASISSANKMWLFALTLPAICLCGAGLAEIGIEVQGERTDPSNYWQRPLAPQGSPPAEWTALEQSLAPEDCRQCHMDQFQQWRRSRHAQAFSPGLVGQLLNFDTAVTADCMHCHAPLAEQLVAFEAARALGVAHVREQQGLAAAGNGCGGCHLRQHEHFGPPQRGTGAIGPSSYYGAPQKY